MQNSENSRNTIEVYPRMMFTFDKITASAGYDFAFKQTDNENWKYEWKLPVYVEYKF